MVEFSNVARRKMGKDWPEIHSTLLELVTNFQVLSSTRVTILDAAGLADKYLLSWFDSLIISAGLETGSTVIYSEDLNDSQLFEGKLRVVNPFKKPSFD